MSLFSNKLEGCGTMNEFCDVCFGAKQTRLSFSISENKASECFELINCDIWDVCRTESMIGAHYLLPIIDDTSRGTWLYQMKERSEAS